MLNFEVIVYFHLYKYLWIPLINKIFQNGDLYRDIRWYIWCYMQRINSSRNTIQAENVNCGMQFR